MKKSLFLFALPMLAVSLFIGCEGDEGPQGPQGDKGDQGEQGIQGEQGEQGEPGTANVIYSDWAPAEGSWRDSTMFGANFKVNHLTAADLTQDVLDNGVILCYAQYSSNIVPLPYTNAVYTLSFHLDLNRIVLTTLKTDLTGGVELISTVHFRYIIIPGGTAATKSTLDFGSMSYSEVCTWFNIPE